MRSKEKKGDRYRGGILDGEDHKENGYYQSQNKKEHHNGFSLPFQMD